MNAKLAKLLRRKAKEAGWDEKTIKQVTEGIKGLNAEGRAIIRRALQNMPTEKQEAK